MTLKRRNGELQIPRQEIAELERMNPKEQMQGSGRSPLHITLLQRGDVDKKCTHLLRSSLLGIGVMLFSVLGLHAQGRLSIVKVLSPYDLTATLLSNGHFSITTEYTGEVKTLIYQEDGSGGRPVNYTSHVHFKVDDVIFQLPYELNPITRDVPPQNPLTITRLYRDTVAGVPRINTDMVGIMPNGDTMRFKLWMEPVKRPSGGFIRISTEVWNTTSTAHQVGVLQLIDTKIGDNDRAPIISAFGYETTETEFDKGVLPGMPPFWLGLEGSPTQPGLTARGNLTAPGLITPDYFLFGNWKDNTLVNAVGLALAQWDERRAVNTDYTDSSILLLWKEKTMNPGERETRSSTEIGLVDSLNVSFGSGGWGGIGLAGGGIGGGGGTGGGCLAFDTVAQGDCNDPNFHPYSPDSLQALFLVTNTTAPQLDGTEIVIESLPRGLQAGSMSERVIPSTLIAEVTGVGTLTFRALPRLFDTNYAVPIAVRGNGGEIVLRDTLCIYVPGLPAELTVTKSTFLPLCPGLSDTISVPVSLEGPVCLDILPTPQIIGAAPDANQFAVVMPTPAKVPANGETAVHVAYTSTLPGTVHNAKLVVYATRRGLNRFDRDTTVIISDTIDLRGEGREAEFFIGAKDTINFGEICLGDTALREWTITNIGGCDLRIGSDYTFVNDPAGQFAIANTGDFPLLVPRGGDGTALLQFTPKTGGTATSLLIVRSSARPQVDTLVLQGTGGAPEFVAMPPGTVDTICPDERARIRIRIDNPTPCPVPVDSITLDNPAFSVDASGGLVLPPKSGRDVIVAGAFATPGTYQTTATFHSTVAGDTVVSVTVVVASRQVTATPALDFGDVRVRTPGTPQTITIRSVGSAGVEIARIRLTGADAAEYSMTLPAGTIFPLRLEPGETLDLEIGFVPADLELRRAAIVIETVPRAACAAPEPITLTGRGVLPVLDAPQRRIELGRSCVGRDVDTVITLRNLGNAPLTITGVKVFGVQGTIDVEVTGLPMTLGPDSSGLAGLKTRLGSLGPLITDLYVESDGEPLTPTDTLIRIEAGGIVCGSIALDTVRTLIGSEASITLRLDVPGLTLAEVADLMNSSGLRGISLSIEHDRSIFRLSTDPPTRGMLTALSPPADISINGTQLFLRTDNTHRNIGAGTELAVLTGDVLLGRGDRTPLRLNVESFADGWSDLTVHNGLLIAEYCAIDQRFVQLAKPFIRAATVPTPKDGAVQLYLPEEDAVVVRLFDGTGAQAAILFSGNLSAGVHRLQLPQGISSGIYIAELTTGTEHYTVRILLNE